MSTCNKWALDLIEKREKCRTVSLAFLYVKSHAEFIESGNGNRNGHDMLRLVAQYIWNLRFSKESSSVSE